MLKKPIILASTSPARKMLLERLGLPFSTQNPDVGETPLPAETPEALVKRLAVAKAKAVGNQHPNAWVIGADQVALCQNRILGKPITEATAFEYLSFVSGRQVNFLVGLCLLDTTTGKQTVAVENTIVFFRILSPETIKAYIQKERPLGCAGSFKSEGLGITLVEKIVGNDPTALIGLPLIRLTEMLQKAGVTLP